MRNAKNLKWFLILSSPFLILCVVIGGLRYHGIKEEKAACMFLEKTLLLLAERDKTYRNFLENRAQEDIPENIQNITNEFTVSIVDYDFGTYDYRIFFKDTNRSFRATVSRNPNGEFRMTSFFPDY